MTSKSSGAPDVTREEWGIRLRTAAVASVIMALIGPFTTYEMFTFAERLLYWGGLILGLFVPACLIRKTVFNLIPGPEPRIDFVAAAVISIVIGPSVWAFNLFVMGFDVGDVQGLVEHVGICLLACLVPVALRIYMRAIARVPDRESEKINSEQTVARDDTHVFLRRLDPDKRGVLSRVSAADHQLVVCTENGESRLRMRFSDALKELADLPGSRIHRSHWVAHDAISSVNPDGRRYSVTMICGTVLPVSQKGVVPLRQAGLLVN